MTFSKLALIHASLVLAFVASGFPQGAGIAVHDDGSIKHFGEGPSDERVHCIDTSISSHTLIYPETYRNELLKIQCASGQSNAQTIKNILAQGFRVLSNGEWAFLVPDDIFTGRGLPFKVSWTILSVDADLIGEADSVQQLAPKQLTFLKEELIRKTRLIPVQADVDGASPEVAAVHLRYTLFAHRNQYGRMSVVALLHEGDELGALGTYGRLIYGEMVGDKVELQWDSPLLFAADLQLEDINGDGYDEIILQATVGWAAHGPGTQIITIFDHNGRELTRQQDCKWMDNTADFKSAPDRICPVGGGQVSLQVTSTGPLIKVTQDSQVMRSRDVSGSTDTVYVLKGEHFVISGAHAKTLYPKSH